MTVSSLLITSCRRYRGVSGRSLARHTGSSQAGLVELERGAKDATVSRLDGLLRALGYRVCVLPSLLPTAADVAEEMRGRLDSDDNDGGLRVAWQLSTDLMATDPALRVALCVTPPAPTGSRRFDALLAGIVELSLCTDELPRPSWLDESWRTLQDPWDVEPVVALRAQARVTTPEPLRRHGVYLDAAELLNV